MEGRPTDQVEQDLHHYAEKARQRLSHLVAVCLISTFIIIGLLTEISTGAACDVVMARRVKAATVTVDSLAAQLLYLQSETLGLYRYVMDEMPSFESYVEKLEQMGYIESTN